jgi:hypothetical protein
MNIFYVSQRGVKWAKKLNELLLGRFFMTFWTSESAK